MLITLLSYRESLSFEDIVFMLLGYAVVIFVALPFHEMAHAFAADRLGDHTAKWNGRLTMNPLKHLDVLGTVMICLCGFGYAKPVPVNPYNFKHPKRDMALTALAGPLSNLLMAALSLAIFRVLYTFVDSIWFLNMAARVLISTFASINIGLAVFNLLPIEPLDGGQALYCLLAMRMEEEPARKWVLRVSVITLFPIAAAGFFVLVMSGYNITLLAVSLYLSLLLLFKEKS